MPYTPQWCHNTRNWCVIKSENAIPLKTDAMKAKKYVTINSVNRWHNSVKQCNIAENSTITAKIEVIAAKMNVMAAEIYAIESKTDAIKS